MTLIVNELEIIKIKDLKNMNIPDYQRPYSWSTYSVNILFDDIYKAFKENLKEYRLGTLILHYKDNKYDIVDGQQRLTTIAILLYCLNEKCKEQSDFLLNTQYNDLSYDTLLTNYTIIQQRVNDLKEESADYRKYLLEHCSFVKIVTNSEQEAFQFFDSQNSRGKELHPHDLLKSYHLREMRDFDMDKKINLINKWENINPDYLEELFKNYLYPITQWYRCREGINYSTKKIGQFKGITYKNNYNYAVYHKSSNLFVEQFNQSGNNELLNTETLNQFQLTQPIIAGHRFFEYSIHYKNLLEKVQQKIEIYHKDTDEIPDKRTGDKYIKQLYECALLFLADRFGLNLIDDSNIRRIIYTWCYLLRLKMSAVYLKTVNKYACGEHENKTKISIKLFSYINDCNAPNDLYMLLIQKPDKDDISNDNKRKYSKIYEKIFKDNGWLKNENE